MIKEITISAIIALVISLGIPLSGVLTKEELKIDEFICEARLELGSYPCESLSKYYGLSNGKCINSETGNKLCRTGWIKIVKEMEPSVPTGSDITCDSGKCR